MREASHREPWLLTDAREEIRSRRQNLYQRSARRGYQPGWGRFLGVYWLPGEPHRRRSILYSIRTSVASYIQEFNVAG